MEHPGYVISLNGTTIDTVFKHFNDAKNIADNIFIKSNNINQVGVCRLYTDNVLYFRRAEVMANGHSEKHIERN